MEVRVFSTAPYYSCFVPQIARGIQVQPLSAVCQDYQDRKDINPKRSEQYFRRIVEVVGDLPIDQYTRSHAKEFLQFYSKQKTSTRAECSAPASTFGALWLKLKNAKASAVLSD